MRMRWFGEPWPSEDLRAPACENEDLRVPVPVGKTCQECNCGFDEKDQGVVMAAGGTSPSFPLRIEGAHHLVAAYHLECFLRVVLGPAR